MRGGATAGRLGLALLGLTLALLAVEGVLRMTFRPAEIQRLIGPAEPIEAARWVDHPFLPFVGKPNAAYVANITVNGEPVAVDVRNNSYGFRSHEFPTSKAPEDYFVVALGESTTWGAAAETNAATWPERLEALLRARYPGRSVRVFNLGTQNVTVAYSVVVLSLIGVSIQPDLVLVYHGFNDLGPATALGYRTDHAHFFRDLAFDRRWYGVQKSLPRFLLDSYTVAYLSSLADVTIGANSLSYYVQRPVRFDESLDDAGVKAALARNWQHLSTINAIARGYGARTLFATFQFYDGSDRFRQLVNETLRERFVADDVPYVDQDALIPDHDRGLQYDDCHFTRAGDELMAENFFRAIVERGFIEPAK